MTDEPLCNPNMVASHIIDTLMKMKTRSDQTHLLWFKNVTRPKLFSLPNVPLVPEYRKL
jgi:hypothetical protein